MTKHNELGKLGEQIAKHFLEEAGYEILEENWIFMKSEIDLVAYFKGMIIFVEVKARTYESFGKPEEFVHKSKRGNIMKAAEEYIYRMGHKGEVRFDIISILFSSNSVRKFEHIRDAYF